KEMLKKFWELAEKYDQFVSFNGRGFDVPYLVIRSMKHKVKPSKDLMSNRYLSSQRYGAKHIDLLDQLSFYGAVWKKPSLHLCCRTLGIESPKTQGVCGDDVAKLFKEKKFLDIARYNVRDIVSTDEVYEYWRDYLNL
ncbi:MAG: ribonuclease H-like domain-containing protein, partial [Parcubacteria group bacterium]|nr:ribonuclease H-like domain-containing protein [Parcubacteria group bacterium]